MWLLGVGVFKIFKILFEEHSKGRAEQGSVDTETSLRLLKNVFPLLSKPPVLHKALHFHLGTERQWNGTKPTAQKTIAFTEIPSRKQGRRN